MPKINKKILLFILFYCVFLFLTEQAMALEIEYPRTMAGTVITDADSSNLGKYVKYIFEAGLSIALAIVFLTLVISGVLFFLSPSPSAIQMAKERISGAISGLLILILTYLIITTINPNLTVFNINSLEKIDIPVAQNASYGLNVCRDSGCQNVSETYLSSVEDFGTSLKNKIGSVFISQDYYTKTTYVALLYDNINSWGRCQYINPNTGCQLTNISVASASVYEYDFSPNSRDGVFLYRNSFNSVSGKEDNRDNGYLKISGSQIGKLYWQQLKSLSFIGEGGGCTVPESQQDCIEWSDSGICKKRQCPSLDGENLSSIKIDGNYLVVLLYIDPNDSNRRLTYSYCQAFPTKQEVNKDGPQQIKWDPIRSSGYKPNHILIIPIKNK